MRCCLETWQQENHHLVTKKPKFERGGELSFRSGSYAFLQTID